MILGPLGADFIPSPSGASKHQEDFQAIITALSQNLGVEPSFRAVSTALGNLADPPYTAKDSASLTNMLDNIRNMEVFLRKENEKSSSELTLLALNQLIAKTQTQLSQIGETISQAKIQKENRQNLNTLNPATFSQQGLSKADLEASRDMAGVSPTEEEHPFSFKYSTPEVFSSAERRPTATISGIKEKNGLFFPFSVRIPHKNGSSACPGEYTKIQPIPAESNLQPSPSMPRIEGLLCTNAGGLPCPLSYRITDISCFDENGKKIEPGIVSVFEHTTTGQYRVECLGMRSVSYTITPSPERESTLYKKIAASTTPPADLHRMFSREIQPWIQSNGGIKKLIDPNKPLLEQAKRILASAIPGANLAKTGIYDSDALTGLLLKTAHEKGVLDLLKIFFPVGRCDDSANFCARFLTVMGIPSFQLNGYTNWYHEFLETQVLSGIGHATVISSLEGKVVYSDLTPDISLDYRGENAQTVKIRKLFSDVIIYIQSANFSTVEESQELVEFLKIKFSQLTTLVDQMVEPDFDQTLQQALSVIYKNKKYFFTGSLTERKIRALSPEKQQILLETCVRQYAVSQYFELQEYTPENIKKLDEEFKEFTKKLEKHYSVQQIDFSIDAIIRDDEITEYLFTHIRSKSSLFLIPQCPPMPDPKQQNLGNFLLSVMGLEAKMLDFIEKFHITPSSWESSSDWVCQQMRPLADILSKGGLSYSLTMVELAFFYRLLTSNTTIPAELCKTIIKDHLQDPVGFFKNQNLLEQLRSILTTFQLNKKNFPKPILDNFYIRIVFPHSKRGELGFFLQALMQELNQVQDLSCSHLEMILPKLLNRYIESENGKKFLTDLVIRYANELLSTKEDFLLKLDSIFFGILRPFYNFNQSRLPGACFLAPALPLLNPGTKQTIQNIMGTPTFTPFNPQYIRSLGEQLIGTESSKRKIIGALGGEIFDYRPAAQGKIPTKRETLVPFFLDRSNLLKSLLYSISLNCFPIEAQEHIKKLIQKLPIPPNEPTHPINQFLALQTNSVTLRHLFSILYTPKMIAGSINPVYAPNTPEMIADSIDPDYAPTYTQLRQVLLELSVNHFPSKTREQMDTLLRQLQMPINDPQKRLSSRNLNTIEDIDDVLYFLNNAMIVSEYRGPILSQETKIPKTEHVFIMVDFYHMLNLGNTKMFFDFLVQKQRMLLKQKNATCTIGFYWHDQLITRFDLMGRNLKTEITNFYSDRTDSWIDPKTNSLPDSFFHSFVFYLLQAQYRMGILTDGMLSDWDGIPTTKKPSELLITTVLPKKCTQAIFFTASELFSPSSIKGLTKIPFAFTR